MSKLIEQAMRQRPDISSGRASLRAKEYAVRFANSNLLPALNLGGQTDWNSYKYYDHDKNKEHNYGYLATLALDWDFSTDFIILTLSARQRQS